MQKIIGSLPTARFWAIGCLLLVVALASLLSQAAIAQPQPRIEAEGVPGKPYGVGVLVVELPRLQRMAELDSGQVSLSERQGRILYPIYETRRVNGPVAARHRRRWRRRRLTVYFLFTGNEPLDLTLSTPQPIRATLTPRAGGNAEQRPIGGAGFNQRPATDIYPEIDDYHDRHAGSPDAACRWRPTGGNWLSGSLSGQFELLGGGEWRLRTRLARQALIGRCQRHRSGPLDQPLAESIFRRWMPAERFPAQPAADH